VDFVACCPPGSGRELAMDRYFNRPEREREVFAHRYTELFFERWRKLGRLPFAPLGTAAGVEADGLEPAWFSNLAPAGASDDIHLS
jgi:hypothetical protein